MPPSNISFVTATTIGSFPFNFTQTDINDAGVNFTVYYRFVAPVGAKVISAWGFSGNIGAGYRPTIFPYNGPAGAPVSVLGIAAQNKPVQFPVVVGNEYFLEFVKNVNTVGPEDLTIKVEVHASEVIPTGSIIVNDDNPGFPLAFLPSNNGNNFNVLDYLQPFPAGEEADVLQTSGKILYDDDFTDFTYKLYTNNLAFIMNIAHLDPIGENKIRACQGTSRFWLGNAGVGGFTNARVRSVDGDGNLGAITYDLGDIGLSAMAANNNETILYYSGAGGSFNSQIKRWDLVLNVVMADLVPDFGGSYQVADILVLADDSIIVTYWSAPANDFTIKRYNAAGATLNTYALGTVSGGIKPRTAYAIDNPNSIWNFRHLIGADFGIARFANIRCSDGVILSQIDQAAFTVGVYDGPETATPYAMFGESSSCTLVILRSTLTSPFSGIYILEVGKRNDTLYTSLNPVTTEIRKIPDPKYRTAFLGE